MRPDMGKDGASPAPLEGSGLLPQTESERPDEEQIVKGVQHRHRSTGRGGKSAGLRGLRTSRGRDAVWRLYAGRHRQGDRRELPSDLRRVRGV